MAKSQTATAIIEQKQYQWMNNIKEGWWRNARERRTADESQPKTGDKYCGDNQKKTYTRKTAEEAWHRKTRQGDTKREKTNLTDKKH